MVYSDLKLFIGLANAALIARCATVSQATSE